MNIYTKSKINLITFFITTSIIFLIYYIFPKLEIQVQAKEYNENNKLHVVQEVTKIGDTFCEQKNEKAWMIEIPSINLIAEIAEGTDEETMNKYVGHFEDTSKDKGNVGLAAHNRGYPVNYFEKIKELKKGDKIYYSYNRERMIYEVDKIEIIKDTNWSYLEQTEKNKITLITCVENEPEYRRCIQATEMI